MRQLSRRRSICGNKALAQGSQIHAFEFYDHWRAAAKNTFEGKPASPAILTSTIAG